MESKRVRDRDYTITRERMRRTLALTFTIRKDHTTPYSAAQRLSVVSIPQSKCQTRSTIDCGYPIEISWSKLKQAGGQVVDRDLGQGNAATIEAQVG